VSGERRERILAALMAGGPANLGAARLCEMSREVTGVTGAGIMLMSGDTPYSSVCTTSDVSALLEDLQITLGEGPCVDAFNHHRPVLEPDLADPKTPRWVAFSGPAVDAGVRAIFGFPLQVGAVRLGALNLYCDEPGPLTEDQHADALIVAEVIAQTLLVFQAAEPAGVLAEALDAGTSLQHIVHQAAGMVSAQLEVTVGQALVRLRAYAFANERPLTEVAADVVARRLRFRDGEPEGGTPP
jgi:hypothetical protein